MENDSNDATSAEVNIQTHLRIRPSKSSSGYFKIDDITPTALHFYLPETFKPSSDYVNNTKTHHCFQFHGIIPMDTSQEDVFKKVGIDCVRNALDGYNSTIFTYGQTGSGKTYTLTGGQVSYKERGLIPRTISMIFQELKNSKDRQYKFYFSYMEIYNEHGYDLLGASDRVDLASGLDTLPKVSMLEDEHGNFHIKNLSMNVADSEEDALDLLFMGETNRAVAETPMNLASSRSHCIFTISIEGRIVGTEKVRRSKLHLVDLAGSERVGKTNSSGAVLQQAKYINSSLFYLEMVIVALYEKATKGRTHIPYRNSMMTSALRDSLGGNCKTIMIATINPESAHTDESLSTCRFAQRVSMIKNKATINEDVDPSLVIRKLKNEMLNLREEIGFLKGEAGEGEPLTSKEIEELKTKCRVYCDDLDPTSILDIGKLTLTKIKDAFAIMKNFVLEERSKHNQIIQNNNSLPSSNGIGTGGNSSVNQGNDELLKQISDLKSSLLEREHEISILVNMVKKGVKVTAGPSPSLTPSSVNSQNLPNSFSSTSGLQAQGPGKSFQQRELDREVVRQTNREDLVIKRHLFGVPPPPEKSIFDDAAASYEWFRERCQLNSAMDENRDLLKEKINEAKIVGERANQSRNTITYLKNSIESIRKERVLQGITNKRDSKIGNDDSEHDDDNIESAEEITHRKAIEQEKVVYKESFEKLRILKPEIEHIRKLLENCQVKIQSQFDEWYNTLHTRNIYDNSTNISVDTDVTRSSVANTSIATMTSSNSVVGSMNSFSSANNTSSSLNSTKSSNGPNSVSSRIDHMSPIPGDKSSTVSINRNSNNTQVNQINSVTASSNRVPKVAASKDDSVNNDILAFYQAKEELMRRRATSNSNI